MGVRRPAVEHVRLLARANYVHALAGDHGSDLERDTGRCLVAHVPVLLEDLRRPVVQRLLLGPEHIHLLDVLLCEAVRPLARVGHPGRHHRPEGRGRLLVRHLLYRRIRVMLVLPGGDGGRTTD